MTGPSLRRGVLLLLVLVVCALLASGCDVPGTGDGDSKPKDDGAEKAGSKEPAGTELVIHGKEVDEDGNVDRAPTADGDVEEDAAADRPRRDLSAAVVELADPPALLDDGTIDDGDDPFASGNAGTPLLPIPVEDDPSLTEALDTWEQELTRALELVDPVDFERWLAARMSLNNSTRDDGAAPFAPYLVEVLARRCGGARTTASGVLVGGELVVTTVHAIESVERRVRVQVAIDGTERRYPAMIQYLDVDDDIAVLRVPGLAATGIDRLGAMPGPAPSFGYAMGVADGGRGVRRVPIVLGADRLSATVEQPDGLARQITDRDVHPMLGGVTNGFSGGMVVVSTGGDAGPWELAGLVRARVPWRSRTASVVIPIDLVNEAIAARNANPEWSELVPRTGCAQWAR